MNVIHYLKDIDAEITAHRQEIAKHQLRIAQLQDMRVLMMSREEERAHATGQPSPFGALPDGSEIAVRDPLAYQPYLAAAALAAPPAGVVSALPADERRERERERKRAIEHTPERRNYKREYYRRKAAERAAVIAKYSQHGAPDEGGEHVNGRKVRKDKGKPKGPYRTRGGGVRGALMARVKQFFLDRPATPLMSREVIDLAHPGRVPTKDDKQDIYIVLYELKKAGFITQSQALEPYTLVRP